MFRENYFLIEKKSYSNKKIRLMNKKRIQMIFKKKITNILFIKP